MVRQNTVLILGAGASVDYGYPTGKDLSNDIGDSNVWRGFADNFVKYMHTRKSGYVHGFNEIEKHFFPSRSLSIDSWLAKPDNSEYVEAGKLLIAFLIGRKESSEFSKKGFFKFLYPKGVEKGDWYRLLFNEMATDNFEDFGSENSKLSIVTFNYDRSLEYFLLTAMQNTYTDRTPEECWDQLLSVYIASCLWLRWQTLYSW